MPRGGGPTIALALGAGGARGLAHIAVLEALDEMGLRPAAIAGVSIGALIGAAYAAGMSGREIRAQATALLHDRGEVMRRLLAIRVGRVADLLATGNPMLVNAEGFIEQFLPKEIPARFEELQTPLAVVATDFWQRKEVIFSARELRPALAGSLAIPALLRPVEHDGRILVDGGAVNPLPFDLLRGAADIVVAVDVTGGPAGPNPTVPDPFEALFATLAVMSHAIIAEKLKSGAPDLLLRPKVDAFAMLDFFRISAILRAAEPIKEELKRQLGARLDR
ncbi:MAG: patatin-like phospholipase family protein [Xanthobacteraceae bacterium]|nr:patatin-like phospholipase family protein [Xanthobacteraceae bacterium]